MSASGQATKEEIPAGIAGYARQETSYRGQATQQVMPGIMGKHREVLGQETGQERQLVDKKQDRKHQLVDRKQDRKPVLRNRIRKDPKLLAGSDPEPK
jgi:hypothetical protein